MSRLRLRYTRPFYRYSLADRGNRIDIDIITDFMCDRFGDTCGANEAANAACMAATAATKGKTGQAAGMSTDSLYNFSHVPVPVHSSVYFFFPVSIKAPDRPLVITTSLMRCERNVDYGVSNGMEWGFGAHQRSEPHWSISP